MRKEIQDAIDRINGKLIDIEEAWDRGKITVEEYLEMRDRTFQIELEQIANNK